MISPLPKLEAGGREDASAWSLRWPPRLTSIAALFVLTACPTPKPAEALSAISSFQVRATNVFVDNVGAITPLPVVALCADQYGGQSNVPAEARGTQACPYSIARGEINIEIEATALDQNGEVAGDFADPVSFRVVPGELTGSYAYRWAQANGGTAKGKIRTAHQYGPVRVWAEHAPPDLLYADGGYAGNLEELPKAPEKWTFATGLSPIVYFEEPTIAAVQTPDLLDNRSSPLVGEFLNIGRAPESGSKLLQSCANDPERDGEVVQMVVTGTNSTGFFVTDLSACRTLEDPGVRPPEPNEACIDGTCAISKKACKSSGDCSRYNPSTFGHIFVYNYSFPEGLDVGDLLWTLSGSIQEFTGSTQLVFPSWTVAERVRQLPKSEWGKYLDQVPIVDINLRMCGADNAFKPFLTDAICGQNRRNMKMESNESGLVRLRNARFPKVFVNCDLNGDGTLPSFCEQTDSTGKWIWGSCSFGEVESAKDQVERVCHHDCVIGMNEYANTICAEQSTFTGFGQYVVEITPPGLDGTRLDSSLPGRFLEMTLSNQPTTHATKIDPGSWVAMTCTAPARYRFGDGSAVDSNDPVLQAGLVLSQRLEGNQDKVAVLQADATQSGKCSISIHPRTRVSIITKDAIPELRPNCNENDSDEEAAKTCKALHAATFDIVGHLRQTQPARPRWVVTPRDADDVCCRPAPGMTCPKPIRQCEGLTP